MCDVPVDAVFCALALLSNCFPHESLLWIEDDWPKERKRKGEVIAGVPVRYGKIPSGRGFHH